MLQRLLSGLVVSVVVAAPAAAEGPAIEHQPLACVVAGRFPKLEARFAPANAVARARVQFQAEGTRHWYGVAMAPAGPGFAAVLPRPKKSLKSYRYYIEVTDTALGTSRTAEYKTTVGAGATACSDVQAAQGLASAAVNLEVPAGAPAAPGGFSTSGVIAVSAGAAGAMVAAGATTAAAAAGGGISTAVLVVGGVAVAGAGAAVVATRAGEGGGTTAYEGSFNGQSTWVTAYTDGEYGCTRTDAIAGTVTIVLHQADGSVSGTVDTDGTNSMISSDCQGGSPSVPLSWGAQLNGTAGRFTGRNQSEQTSTGAAVVSSTASIEFAGALSGGAITGTLTFGYSQRGVQTTGRTFGGETTVTMPVTLRER
jgi:hypothetical protein